MCVNKKKNCIFALRIRNKDEGNNGEKFDGLKN